ncbi:hypothetical protein A2U01_0117346, partial [Trifolium medium]|nr:hypothetical protein [Trifolium medium]
MGKTNVGSSANASDFQWTPIIFEEQNQQQAAGNNNNNDAAGQNSGIIRVENVRAVEE